jgi:hypothetical protein
MSAATAKPEGPRFPSPSRIATGLFLTRLGKHLVVLACLLIVGQASGRFDIGQLAIFILIVASAASHSSGKAFLNLAPPRRSPP